MTTVARVNIPELLANSPIGPLQKRVFLLCLSNISLHLIIAGTLHFRMFPVHNLTQADN